MGINETLVYWNVCRYFPLAVYHLHLHSSVNKKDIYQAHAMIFAIRYPHDCSQELTPWWWYEQACDLFCVPPEMTGLIEFNRIDNLPKIPLGLKQEPSCLSETYQLVKFYMAAQFMLLMCSEEQYEFVTARIKHDSKKENFSSKEHELQFKPCSAFVPEKETTGSIRREG